MLAHARQTAVTPLPPLPAAAIPTVLAPLLQPRPPQPTIELERTYRKQRLAASFRLFSRFGFDHGIAGHITVRDPQYTDCFWVNPAGLHFSHIRVSDLMLVNHDGKILEHGVEYLLNEAAFAIHSRLHAARPDVEAAAHSHSIYGKAWSALGELLAPITLDSCAFYEDHALYDTFSGIVLDVAEGDRIAEALGRKKAVILQNHGILTVGSSVEAAVWNYLSLDNACHEQLLARAAGALKPVPHDVAKHTADQNIGAVGEFMFKPYFELVARAEPDLFD